jgi:hypothetical protein
MRIKFLIAILFLIFSSEIFSQVIPFVSNVLRYGDGKRFLGTLENNFRYFENLTDARIQLSSNINAGIRLLYDNPPEVGLKYKGLKRKFAEYDGEHFYGRIGTFSQLFSKGLAMNLFESRGLGYDTWMEGINAKYKSNKLSATAIYGILNFEDSLVTKRVEKHKLLVGNIEYYFADNLKLGFTFLNSNSGFEIVNQNVDAEINITSIYFNYIFSEFTFSLDYANKKTKEITTGKNYSGAALYGALSYSGTDIGITIDYKNYLFDEKSPFERNDFSRPTRMLPFQNPPIVMKEHTYTLLTRAIHEIDFNDEVGFQIEVFYPFSQTTSLNLNASFASRHNYYEFDKNSFVFIKKERGTNFYPSLDKKYSPYYELFGEIEHYINESIWIKTVLANRKKIIYNEYAPNFSHEVSSTIAAIQLNSILSDVYSFEGQIEYEKVFDNYNANQHNFYNILFTLINSFWSKFTFSLRYEFTDNNFDLSRRKNWFTIESSYRITSTNTITIAYGKDRGGQVCTNGVCRYIQPFEGFRFSIISNF